VLVDFIYGVYSSCEFQTTEDPPQNDFAHESQWPRIMQSKTRKLFRMDVSLPKHVRLPLFAQFSGMIPLCLSERERQSETERGFPGVHVVCRGYFLVN